MMDKKMFLFVFTAAVHLGACEAAQHPRFVVVVVVVVVVVIGAAAGEDGCVSGEDEDEEGCGGGGDEQASRVVVASAVVCHHHQNGACSEGCSQHPRLTVVLAGGKTAAEADADAEAQAARELEEAEAMADALGDGDGDGDGEPTDSGTPVAPLTRGNLAKHRFRDAGMDVVDVVRPDSAPYEPTALEKVVTEATEMAKMLEEPDGAVE